MSSPAPAEGVRLAPLPPPRRGMRDFELPDLTADAPAEPEPQQAEDLEGFTPLLVVDAPQEDPRQAAERQAREMLASAESEAKAIREEARKEGYDTGYQKGYKTGMDEGLVASKARIEAACDNLGRALKVLDQARAAILAVMENEMVALVQAATDRILLAPEAIDPALVQRTVREAVTRVVDAERLSVRLHPQDLAHVREFRPRLMEELGGLAHLEIKADAALRRGDCLVDTPTAQVDASLETRRKQIFALIDDAFRQGQRLDMEQVLTQAQAQPQAPPAAEAAAPPAPETPPPQPDPAAAGGAPDGQSQIEDW